MQKHPAPSIHSRRREKAEVPDQSERSASSPRRLRGFRLGAWCFSGVRSLVLGAFLVSFPATSRAQPTPHIGYVFPAGGRQGATAEVTVGGQFLDGVTNAFVTGAGVRAEVIEFNKPMPQGQFNQLRDKIRELQDRKQAARREPNSTNTWSAVDEKEMASLREKILKNPPNRQGTPAIAETVRVRVLLATNALVGPREIRLGTPNGLSNPMVFHVGDLAEHSASPAKAANPDADRFRERLGRPGANAPEQSEMRVTLPATVNGQIMPGEVDHIRFAARKGQHLVVKVAARALIPYLADAVPGWFQATLAVFDAKGNELAYADDYRFDPDPTLHLSIPRDGEYTLEIKDAIYRGREDFVYRVTIGELPFVTSRFPLGGPAAKASEVELAGWNLGATTVKQIVSFAETGTYRIGITNKAHISNTLPFAVDDWPEGLEKEPNNTTKTAQLLTLPIIVNGRINPSGDTDVFSFTGRAGEIIVAEVTARRLNSPLDSVLRLMDAAGRQIALNDDTEDKAAGLETHHADSYLRATLPANGSYYVELRDTQQNGGSEFAYRLRVGLPRPDFELRVVPSSLSIRGGATMPLTVFALRKDGFTNDIWLALPDAPSGFKLSGGSIPAGQDQIRVTLTVPPSPSEEPVSLALEGRAIVSGHKLAHPVIPADDMMQAFIYQHLVPARELQVMVLSRGLQRGSPRIVSELPLRIPVGGSAQIKVAAPGAGLADRFQLELDDPPEGIVLQKVQSSREGTELVMAAVSDKLKPGTRGNLIVSAFANRPNNAGRPNRPGNNRRQPVGTLPAIPFEIVTAP